MVKVWGVFWLAACGSQFLDCSLTAFTLGGVPGWRLALGRSGIGMDGKYDW